MAQFDVDENSVPNSRVDSAPQPATPNSKAVYKLPGISYIPDKIEVAEDQILLSKINHQMLDFIKVLTQLLDLISLVKPKHLRSSQPIPAIIIEEMLLNQGKGLRLKTLEAKLTDPNPVASPSVENILTHNPGQAHRREPQRRGSNFPFSSDLPEITGKKTRPMWHVVMLEKPEELSIMQPKLPRPRSFISPGYETTYQECRINEELTRTKEETTMFSIKFAFTHVNSTSHTDDVVLQRQIEMMVASQAGFRTVEEHKAYLNTLKSHWYNNFLNDVIRIGLFTCSDMVVAFENLAKHYQMNYNSLPLAKAKLCLVVLSLPYWDIARIETQRAAEFILDKILLLPENPLEEWLRARGIPYVVFPAYCADDFQISASGSEEEELHADAAGTAADDNVGATSSISGMMEQTDEPSSSSL